MPYDPNHHHRRSIRLPNVDYSQRGAYSVTIVTYERFPTFGEIGNGIMNLSQVGRVADQEWRKLSARFPYLTLDEFVVMPNHVHGIIIINTQRNGALRNPNPDIKISQPGVEIWTSRSIGGQTRLTNVAPGSLGAIVRAYKSAVTNQCNRTRLLGGCPLWQRNYHDWIIRNEKDLDHTRQYIRNNPINWELDEDHV